MIQVLSDQPLLALMLTLALGSLVGKIPFGPLRFGAAGALFVGLALGALGSGIGDGMGLVQSVGLALFVYTVGVAAGGTFVRDLKTQWKMMLVAILTLIVVLILGWLIGARFFGLSIGMIAGSFAGTLTATPALAAATSALGGDPDVAVGYSLSYPVGVILAIACVAFLISKKWPGKKDSPSLAGAGIGTVSVVVDRDIELSQIAGWSDEKIKISFWRHQGRAMVIDPRDTTLQAGDEVFLIGPPQAREEALQSIGHKAAEPLTHDRREVDFQTVVVSNPDVLGRTVAEIDIPGQLSGVITRVRRGDLELLAADDLVLQPGDRVLVVVPRDRLDEAADFFGDSARSVSEFDPVAFGLGITAGLLLGMVPIPLGGMTFTLGSAAGPLVVGIILGALHRTGPLTWDLPQSVNLTVRQVGLLLFLAAVGLASGQAFVASAFSMIGVKTGILAGIILMASAVIFMTACRVLGLSAQRTSGGFAGYVGQPAILSFATSKTNDERVESSYAALFATSMVAKIIIIQIFALLVG